MQQQRNDRRPHKNYVPLPNRMDTEATEPLEVVRARLKWHVKRRDITLYERVALDTVAKLRFRLGIECPTHRQIVAASATMGECRVGLTTVKRAIRKAKLLKLLDVRGESVPAPSPLFPNRRRNVSCSYLWCLPPVSGQLPVYNIYPPDNRPLSWQRVKPIPVEILRPPPDLIERARLGGWSHLLPPGHAGAALEAALERLGAAIAKHAAEK